MGIAPLVILLAVMFIPILAIFVGLFLSAVIIAWGLFQRFRPERLAPAPVAGPVAPRRIRFGQIGVVSPLRA